MGQERGGGGGCFPEREVLVLCLDGEPIGRGEVTVGKLKNGKAAGKDENTGEMVKGGSNRVIN